jgi:hypothetical protein
MKMDNQLQNGNSDNLPAEVALPDDPIGRCIATMDLDDREKRNLAFLLEIMVNDMKPTSAAFKVGLHPASGPRLWKTLNDQKSSGSLLGKFMQKAQDNFRLKTVAKLDQVGEVEDKVLKMLTETPEMAAKFPALMRSIKNVAGVLKDEVPPQPTINIQNVANLMLNVGSEGK